MFFTTKERLMEGKKVAAKRIRQLGAQAGVDTPSSLRQAQAQKPDTQFTHKGVIAFRIHGVARDKLNKKEYSGINMI